MGSREAANADDSSAPMCEEVTIPAADGYPLAASLWQGGSGRWVIINSATGVRRRHYRKFAQFLAGRGLSVVSYDYRGIGDSLQGPLRRMRAGMGDWGRLDFNGVLDWTCSQPQASRISVVGHSVGGQIMAFALGAGRIESFVAVACQSGYWRYWPLQQRYLLAISMRVGTLLASMLGYMPTSRLGMGEDLPQGVMRQWADWCLSRDYILGRESRLEGLSEFRGPILSFQFADDFYCPSAAAEAFLAWFPDCPVSRRELRPGDSGAKRFGHFAFFRERFRQSLWTEAADFLDSAPEA